MLDVDVKSGQQGMAHLRGLELLVCPLPPTRSQATPSGGRHLVYRLPRSVARLASRVAFPNGDQADIDILHSGNRFLVEYDELLFDHDIAVLPEAWVPLLEKRRVSRVNRQQSYAGTKAGAGLDALDRLPQAKEGTRNRTLYEVVLDLWLRGLWGENADVVRQQALDTGLDAAEVDKTIASALGAGACEAEKRASRCQAWIHAARQETNRREARNKPIVHAAAAAVAEVAKHHGEPFSMSVRKLAERIGVGSGTAARILLRLREWGLLQRAAVWQDSRANRYQLTFPENCTNWDSHAVHGSVDVPNDVHGSSEGKNERAKCPIGNRHGGGVYLSQHEDFGRDTALLEHAAFVRRKDTVTLPKSCHPVLCALSAGSETVKELAGTTDLAPSTVRRALHILESAGLVDVDYDARRMHKASLVDPDLPSALDRWAASQGCDANAVLLRERHEKQRKGFQERQALAPQDRKTTPGRRTWGGSASSQASRWDDLEAPDLAACAETSSEPTVSS